MRVEGQLEQRREPLGAFLVADFRVEARAQGGGRTLSRRT